MIRIRRRTIATILAALLSLALEIQAQGKVASADPLPSWNDTAPTKAIVTFVERVTKKGSPDFVSLPERIATFDNDGTALPGLTSGCRPYSWRLFAALRTVDPISGRLPIDGRRDREDTCERL